METIQLDYNPEEITYEELLKIFFDGHSPEYDISVRQYQSAIFYHDEEQKQAAAAALQKEEQAKGSQLYTQLMPYKKLYLAEGYHQKYYLQLVDMLKADVRKNYTDFMAFVNSTAAARINGYIKGAGSMEQLLQEIDTFNLSEKSRKRLIEIVESYI